MDRDGQSGSAISDSHISSDANLTPRPLRQLVLSHTGLETRSAHKLAPSIAWLRGLEHLDIRHDVIGPADTKGVTDALATSTRLKELPIPDCTAWIAGACALAPALAACTQLQAVDLSRHAIADEKASAVVAHLLVRACKA